MKKPNLVDPRLQYPTKKLPDQEQGTPALQTDMTPKPDCGEESYKGSEKLLDRTALITGADSGIGRACAIAYAREGADVAIQFFPGEEEDAKEVKELIEKAGRKALLLPADLREDGQGAKLVEDVIAEFGQLDLLVLNAAQQISRDTLEDIPMEEVKDTFKVNIISMFETVKASEKHLPAGSSIILTTSVQATNPSDHLMAYAATKASISNFTVNLANYFAKKGIRVNGVAPGPIWTPLQLDDGQPDGKIPEFGQKTLLERPGQPVELAPVYVFLASNEASYVTSQIYGITGGDHINL